jgi:hypothetical protein
MWTPIHPITWCAPFVGHMGITDSKGKLHDWGGGPIDACNPKYMMFGQPTRYLRFNPPDLAAWDAAIAQADEEYLEYIHCMICGHDCHSHVARVLNILGWWGCTCHNKVVLAAWVFFCGRHTSVGAAVCTWSAQARLEPRPRTPIRRHPGAHLTVAHPLHVCRARARHSGVCNPAGNRPPYKLHGASRWTRPLALASRDPESALADSVRRWGHHLTRHVRSTPHPACRTATPCGDAQRRRHMHGDIAMGGGVCDTQEAFTP